jgi:murein DD-endopeptidase MepM/ murein hydrolase activator NlpD
MMGTCVAVAHSDDTVTFYKNLSKDLADGIAVGATVTRGQTLGYVGDTAVVEMADEPHLHFEMTVKGLAVDPMEYFSSESADALSKDTAFESNAVTEPTTSATTRPNGK